MFLSKQDYLDILNYYNIKDVKASNKIQLRNMVERLIANKLCRCIKKVDKTIKNENSSIAICKNSILKQKSLKISGFSCKKRATLKQNMSKNGLIKMGKKLTMKYKNRIIK